MTPWSSIFSWILVIAKVRPCALSEGLVLIAFATIRAAIAASTDLDAARRVGCSQYGARWIWDGGEIHPASNACWSANECFRAPNRRPARTERAGGESTRSVKHNTKKRIVAYFRLRYHIDPDLSIMTLRVRELLLRDNHSVLTRVATEMCGH
jgi:hypothetical protein